MLTVKARCRGHHTYDIFFPERKVVECDHEGDRVRGICIPCAMASQTPDPDARCPECGQQPAQILEQPSTKIRIVRG